MQSDNICSSIDDLISAYSDNELSENECKLVKNHLKECKSCLAKYNSLKNLSLLMKKNTPKAISFNNFAKNAVEKAFNENTINCTKVITHLSSFIDGEISVSLYYEIENHLKDCLKCKREYNRIIKLSNSVKKALNGNVVKENVIKLYQEGDYCNQVSQKISLLYDERLVQEEKVFLQEHLNNCPVCSALYETFKKAMTPIRIYFGQNYAVNHQKLETMPAKAIHRAMVQKQRKIIGSSIAAVIFTAFLAWNALFFTQSIFSNYTKISNNKNVEDAGISYPKSENILFKKFRAKTPEGVLASIYEY